MLSFTQKLLSAAFVQLSLGIGTISQAIADTTATPVGTPGIAPKSASLLESVVPFIGMFAIMYFLMIRPQQKRAKEQQTLLGALKAGDEVLTTSGILGTAREVNDKIVTVEIDRNVKVRMMKTQIAQIIPPTAAQT